MADLTRNAVCGGPHRLRFPRRAPAGRATSGTRHLFGALDALSASTPRSTGATTPATRRGRSTGGQGIPGLRRPALADIGSHISYLVEFIGAVRGGERPAVRPQSPSAQ